MNRKVYVFIEIGIVGMGGGQMYIRNKAEYMHSKGYDVFVFSGLRGDIIISELERYKKYIFPELLDSPFVYTQKTIDTLLKKFEDFLGAFLEVIIESGSSSCALWGELLAERMNGKHIAFLLDERNDKVVPFGYLPFFEFKKNRRELAGITEKSLSLLFRRELSKEENKYLPAFCTNVVEDYYNSKLNEIPKDGIKIGTLGRLDKEYVLPITEEFVSFAKKHKDDKINIIYIGSCKNFSKKRKEILALTKKAKNIRVLFLGYMYPIPKALFNKIDIFVSSAGSARVSYGENRTTISVDARDFQAIGILGYTTQNRLYRSGEKVEKISELLDFVLYKNGLLDVNYIPCEMKIKENVFEPHNFFLLNSREEKDYYPILGLKVAGKDRIKKLTRKICGRKGYFIIRNFYSYLKR